MLPSSPPLSCLVLSLLFHSLPLLSFSSPHSIPHQKKEAFSACPPESRLFHLTWFTFPSLFPENSVIPFFFIAECNSTVGARKCLSVVDHFVRSWVSGPRTDKNGGLFPYTTFSIYSTTDWHRGRICGFAPVSGGVKAQVGISLSCTGSDPFRYRQSNGVAGSLRYLLCPVRSFQNDFHGGDTNLGQVTFLLCLTSCLFF